MRLAAYRRMYGKCQSLRATRAKTPRTSIVRAKVAKSHRLSTRKPTLLSGPTPKVNKGEECKRLAAPSSMLTLR